MDPQTLVRRIIEAGVFIGAVFLAIFVAPNSPFLIIGICLGIFGFIAISKLGRNIWVLFPMTAGLSGTINLIKGGLTPLQLVCIALFFTAFICSKRIQLFAFELALCGFLYRFSQLAYSLLSIGSRVVIWGSIYSDLFAWAAKTT